MHTCVHGLHEYPAIVRSSSTCRTAAVGNVPWPGAPHRHAYLSVPDVNYGNVLLALFDEGGNCAGIDTFQVQLCHRSKLYTSTARSYDQCAASKSLRRSALVASLLTGCCRRCRAECRTDRYADLLSRPLRIFCAA